MNRHLLLAEFARQPWALTPDYLALAASVLIRWSFGFEAEAGVQAKIDEDREILAARRKEAVQESAGMAVIQLFGVLTQRPPENISGSGATSTSQFAAQVRAAAAEPSVESIVIEIDSPGGSVYGIQEAADAVYEARARKPVFAIANSLAASAAYWIGSQASEFYAAPGGEVGSIGIYTAHQFIGKALENQGIETTLISAGKFKTEGNPFEALSPEALAEIQSRVDEYYGYFTRAVARGRGVNVDAVRGGMGEGRVVTAQSAKKMGMIDDVRTMPSMMPSKSAKMKRNRAAMAIRELDFIL